MIERYRDHAANERTFLAWIRTAIAVMAFGFLVERFDLFLQIAGQTLARHALSRTIGRQHCRSHSDCARRRHDHFGAAALSQNRTGNRQPGTAARLG